MFLDPTALYSRHDLLAVISRRTLARMLDAGAILRLRQGVYASPAVAQPVRQAITAGGVLGCISAAASYGLWRPPDPREHLHFDRIHSRRRHNDHVRHWWSTAEPSQPTRTSLLDTLAHVVRCQPRAFAVAVLDSALHGGLVSTAELVAVLDRTPRRARFDFSLLDARAESGVESLVRFALMQAGLECASQVVIAGIGRVDLVVEGRVVVEVDGRRWHGGEQARDYERDLVAHASGLAVVRVDYPHALERPKLVLAAVRRAMRRPVSVRASA